MRTLWYHGGSGSLRASQNTTGEFEDWLVPKRKEEEEEDDYIGLETFTRAEYLVRYIVWCVCPYGTMADAYGMSSLRGGRAKRKCLAVTFKREEEEKEVCVQHITVWGTLSPSHKACIGS